MTKYTKITDSWEDDKSIFNRNSKRVIPRTYKGFTQINTEQDNLVENGRRT